MIEKNNPCNSFITAVFLREFYTQFTVNLQEWDTLVSFQNSCEIDPFCSMTHLKKYSVLWIFEGYVDIGNSTSL